MRDLLPYVPLVLLLGSALLLVADRWLQRPSFGIEVLTVGSLGILTVFGVFGIAIGTPVHGDLDVLPGPMLWVGRVGTALLYGGILFGVLRQPPEGPGRLMWSGLTVFCVFAGFAELVNPAPLSEQLVFLPLAAFLLWRSAGTELEYVVRVAKIGLWGMVVVSAAAALTAEGWVETGGSFIGLDIRLVGVTAHPNQLGPYLTYLLMLNVIEPPRRPWHWIAWGAPLVMLLLTQSKTAWAGALVGAAVLWWFRIGIGIVHRHRWLPLALAVVLVGGLGLVVVEAPEQELLTPEEAENLTTLTGRSDIWGAGLDAFRANPVFGAGSDVYEVYAEQTGQSWAGQAHNEFIQTLAADGLVGFAGLMVYMAVLLFLGVRLAPISGGVSLALVTAFLLRWVTETPARSLSFEHVLLVALMVAWSRQAPLMARLERVGLRDLVRAVAPTPQDRHPTGVEKGLSGGGTGSSTASRDAAPDDGGAAAAPSDPSPPSGP